MLRKSLGKLAKRVSLRGAAERAQDQEDLSNEVVRYQSVAVCELVKLRDGVLDGSEAANVRLLVLARDVDDAELSEGQTVRLIREIDEGRQLLCQVPYAGRKTISPDDVETKARADWTIEDVCEHVVQPPCREESDFFLDLIDPKHVGKTYEGAFVSQARKSKFADLVHSLVEHYKGRDLTKTFVWLDLFCANQPKLTSKDSGLSEELRKKRWDALTFGLHDAIERFDDRLIFFNSWAQPYPLTRAWCVWEIYGIVKCNRSLDLLFAPGAVDDFVGTLRNDFRQVMQSLANVDMRKAECHSAQDLQMIHKAVTESVGFDGLNNKVAALLRRWLIATAKRAVDNARGAHDEKGLALVLNQVGSVIFEHGDNELALQFYQEALAVGKRAFGENHASVATHLNNIGSVYDAQGNYDKALRHYEQALAIGRRALGEDHPDVATWLNNIGSVYYVQEKYDRALQYYEQALAISKKALGEAHPNVATRLNNIGMVHYAQRNHGEALMHYEQALAIDMMAYGENHPGVATDLINISSVLAEQGRTGEARAALSQALAIRTAALGADHPSTRKTKAWLEDL